MEETHPDINEYGQNPRLLYKQIFHPNYNGEIAYFGFARPAFGSIPPTSEMQSRFYAMTVNGDLDLPCRAKMVEVALEDKVRVGLLTWDGGWLLHVCCSRACGGRGRIVRCFCSAACCVVDTAPMSRVEDCIRMPARSTLYILG